MASDINNIGLYIGAPPSSGQTTREVMGGIGTPVMPDGSVESQVGSNHSYWEPNEIQTGVSRDGGRDGAGVSLPQNHLLSISPPYDSLVAQWPANSDRRYGDAIGFSVATDGDYMVVGAPYAAATELSSGGGSFNLDAEATQEYIAGVPGYTEDCYGKISLEITGDITTLWPGVSIYGRKFCWMGIVWTIKALNPGESLDAWSAGSAYVIETSESGTSLALYPCDSSKDCWIGDGTCTVSIGWVEDEAGMSTELRRSGSVSTRSSAASIKVQSGAVYVFKKPRGLITDATNATPIVITVDSWGDLIDKVRSRDTTVYESKYLNGAKIKIEGVGGT